MKKFPFLSLCLLIFLQAVVVSAHGGGVSYEESKDGYFIDIGYQIAPLAHEPIRLDFNTYPENDKQAEDVFTDVWVRITEDVGEENNELYFSGGIDKPVFGATGFTYAFPHEGNYEIVARFQKGTDVVVEASFPIEVFAKEGENKPVNPYAAAGVGFVCGGILTLFIIRGRKNK